MSSRFQHTVVLNPVAMHRATRANLITTQPTTNLQASKSVMHDIMVKLVKAMCEKNIPFSFLVGDMPTYKAIVQLKAENSKLFRDIIPILGAFH